MKNRKNVISDSIPDLYPNILSIIYSYTRICNYHELESAVCKTESLRVAYAKFTQDFKIYSDTNVHLQITGANHLAEGLLGCKEYLFFPSFIAAVTYYEEKHGYLPLVYACIELGAIPSINNNHGLHANPLVNILHCKAPSLNEIFELLLKAGATVNVLPMIGYSLLYHVLKAKKHSDDLIGLLLKHGLHDMKPNQNSLVKSSYLTLLCAHKKYKHSWQMICLGRADADHLRDLYKLRLCKYISKKPLEDSTSSYDF